MDFVHEGVHFHLLPSPARGRALLFFARDTGFFRALFRELQPSVVHGWGTEDSFGLVARQLAPRRHVVGIQGLIKAYRQRINLGPRALLTELTESWTLRKARNVVAESAYSARVAQPLCPNAKIRIIEHPLRAEFLDTTPADGRANRVLYLGAIDERKGISHALRAFAGACGPDWSLHVVGTGSPSQEKAMRQLADELQISIRHDHVLPAQKIAETMSKSSVFLLPTLIDTGPTALKEALALGLWPVCYDNSGPGEYIRKFQFGTLARDQDLQDLSEKLGRDLATRPWSDPVRRARLRVETQAAFSPVTIWSQLLDLYSEIDHRAATPANA